MRAVAYQRVSSEEQRESGAGLAGQLDACRAYAERAGLALVGPFADEAVSGAAPIDKRHGLMEAIGALSSGDILLVAKRDRLGRDPILVAMVERLVARQGARIVSAAGEGTADDDPTSILMRRIVDAFAEYERLIIKSRTRAALGAKRRRGERVGQVPLGYVVVDDGRRSKKGRPVALVPDPAEAAVLSMIRELRDSGMSLRAIAEELDSRGIPTKRGGGGWSFSTVRRVLARTA